MIPFIPEPLDNLRARFKRALTKVYNLQAIIEKREPRPGQDRRNVFDFQDGTRLIVSIDRDEREGVTRFHVSASINPEHGQITIIQVLTINDMKQHIFSKLNDLGDTDRRYDIEWISEKGILHLFQTCDVPDHAEEES